MSNQIGREVRLRRIGLMATSVASAFFISASACSTPAASDKPASPPATGAPPAKEATPVAPTLPAGVLDIERRAVQTLSKHLSVPESQIEVVSITPVDWRDSSLGCPKPDRGYMQVIKPGHRVILRHAGQEYAVHMSGNAAFVCEAGGADLKAAKPELVPVIRLPLDQLKLLARTDLAHKLNARVEDVTVTRTKPVEWTDTSLGCPDSQQTYEPAKAKGYVFELELHGRKFTYHTDTIRLIPCPPLESQ
jgi:hypothetical protein